MPPCPPNSNASSSEIFTNDNNTNSEEGSGDVHDSDTISTNNTSGRSVLLLDIGNRDGDADAQDALNRAGVSQTEPPRICRNDSSSGSISDEQRNTVLPEETEQSEGLVDDQVAAQANEQTTNEARPPTGLAEGTTGGDDDNPNDNQDDKASPTLLAGNDNGIEGLDANDGDIFSRKASSHGVAPNSAATVDANIPALKTTTSTTGSSSSTTRVTRKGRRLALNSWRMTDRDNGPNSTDPNNSTETSVQSQPGAVATAGTPRGFSRRVWRERLQDFHVRATEYELPEADVILADGIDPESGQPFQPEVVDGLVVRNDGSIRGYFGDGLKGTLQMWEALCCFGYSRDQWAQRIMVAIITVCTAISVAGIGALIGLVIIP